ncbi:hypothetical protein Tco_0993629 [Tanacetum coccineum]
MLTTGFRSLISDGLSLRSLITPERSPEWHKPWIVMGFVTDLDESLTLCIVPLTLPLVAPLVNGDEGVNVNWEKLIKDVDHGDSHTGSLLDTESITHWSLEAHR